MSRELLYDFQQFCLVEMILVFMDDAMYNVYNGLNFLQVNNALVAGN